MNTVVAEVANEVGGDVATVKADVTDYPDLPARYGVRTVPTVMLLREGRPTPIVEGPFTRDVASQVERVLHG
jgi:thioredoxin-like negative regulator of GroEL